MIFILLCISFVTASLPQAPIIVEKESTEFMSIWINDTIDDELLVTCQPDSMCIEFGNSNLFFDRDIFQKNNYIPEDFWLPNPCGGNRSFTGLNSIYCIQPGLRNDGTCGLTMQMNDTHVTYKTTLNTDQSRRTSTAIWQQNSFAHFEIPFTCVFPLSEYARTSFIPTYVDPIISITGTGEYAAQMLIYQSKEYSNILMSPPILNATDANGEVTRINAEVNLMSGKTAENIGLELRKCWATPTENDQGEMFILIDDGCPKIYPNAELNMNVKIHNSGDKVFARFSFDIFGFVISNSTSLHCIVEICYDSWCNIATEECSNTPETNNLRRRRSIKGDFMKTTQMMISAHPSYLIHEADRNILKVDEQPSRIIIDTVEPDFLSVTLLSALAAMIVLLLLLIRKACQHNVQKTI